MKKRKNKWVSMAIRFLNKHCATIDWDEYDPEVKALVRLLRKQFNEGLKKYER